MLVNGRVSELDLDQVVTIEELLGRLDLSPPQYWVARNRKMLVRSAYSRVAVSDGDTIEIWRIMSGGRGSLC